MRRFPREKIRKAAEAVSHGHEDRTMRGLLENPHGRPKKRLHIQDRVAVTFHMPPVVFEFLSAWAGKSNLSRSWYILRCVVEGLVRDARLDPHYLGSLDRDVRGTRQRPLEPGKRKARRETVRAVVLDKREARQDAADPLGWLRGLE